MKSIRKEMTRNQLVLLVAACCFIISNIFVSTTATRQYNTLLQSYQQVNALSQVNNLRRTRFKLYSKSHDSGVLQQYYDECELFDRKLGSLDSVMQEDRSCKMMYRIVCQVADYRRELAETYIHPDQHYYPNLMEDIDEVDLEIERCLNQLISHYLKYLNLEFASYSYRLNITNILLNLLFVVLGGVYMFQNRRMQERVMVSVERLADAAREIMNNNLEAPDIEEAPFTELNQVSRTFDQMKGRIRDMITELQESHQMKERLAEAKIRELQMQMNPHFLFNTLSLVIRSIQLGEREMSIQLVKSISKILRSSIEINTTAIPLDAEIELLQAYLYIQKLHLKGRITFCLDVRKSFSDEDVMIPPLTIQPLVENSIQHGLKDRISGGKVDILITEKPDYMEVVVADNGVGFPEMQESGKTQKTGLAQESGQQSSTGSGRVAIPKTSIGLNNVRERLGLYYREEDVLQIARVDDMTRITLKLYKSKKA